MLGCFAVVILALPVARNTDADRQVFKADDGFMIVPHQEPILHLPTPGLGPHEPVYAVITEVTLRGTIQRFRRVHEGVWHELTIGCDPGERTETYLAIGENGRSNLILGTRGTGIGVERFIGNDWSAKLEMTRTSWFPRVSLRFNYFPQEGRVLGFGIDSRNGLVAHYTVWCEADEIEWTLVVRYLPVEYWPLVVELSNAVSGLRKRPVARREYP